MELEQVYRKLDSMNEQISKLRESAARTENMLENLSTLEEEVYTLRAQQNQWKGAMIVISALFSVAATIIARYVFK